MGNPEELDLSEPAVSVQEKEDKWDVVIQETEGKKWKDKNCRQRTRTVVVVFCKICILLAILYVFVCSLGMLGDAFQLLGGKAAGEAFTNNEILNNPIANLMMGVLVTVLLQSSSTTTSIIVTMVGAEILPVGPAIFIVMGANIGTSVTNTIISMGHAYDRDEFRRAFAGATVHDMFNWLCVLIWLPVEWITSSVGWGPGKCGVLCHLSGAIVDSAQAGSANNPTFLKAITKPLTSKIVQIDKNVLYDIAKGENDTANSLLKTYKCKGKHYFAVSVGSVDFGNMSCELRSEDVKTFPCGFVFEELAHEGWQDWKVGICVLTMALVILIIALFLIVKLLTSMLKGPAARVVQKVINSEIPKPFSWLSGYLAILAGLGLTMLLQSSSIFTSTMTPLVGAGVIHINRMYPLTLGSNIGTTFTAILASLATSDTAKFEKSMQVALCHLFFNIFGIIIWYPVPAMRKVPIGLAKILGDKTARHRWFALAYILIMFLAVPAAIFALSLAGWKIMLGVLLPIFLLSVFVVIVNVIQTKKREVLPPRLQTWDCLPRACHTLSFYDSCCARCANDGDSEESPPSYSESQPNGTSYHNAGYIQSEDPISTQM